MSACTTVKLTSLIHSDSTDSANGNPEHTSFTQWTLITHTYAALHIAFNCFKCLVNKILLIKYLHIKPQRNNMTCLLLFLLYFLNSKSKIHMNTIFSNIIFSLRFTFYYWKHFLRLVFCKRW